MAKEPSGPAAQRDSSRIAAMARHPRRGSRPSGPAAKRVETARPAAQVGSPSPELRFACQIRERIVGSRALSTPALGRHTQPVRQVCDTSGTSRAAGAGSRARSVDVSSEVPKTMRTQRFKPGKRRTHRVEKQAATANQAKPSSIPSWMPRAMHGGNRQGRQSRARNGQAADRIGKTPESPPPEMGTKPTQVGLRSRRLRHLPMTKRSA